jgi:seryl-tRNA synthetase
MLDPLLFRQELEATAKQLARRGVTIDQAQIGELEARRKSVQIETERLQAERTKKSKAIGQAKAKGEDIQPYLDAVADLGGSLDKAKEALSEVQQQQLDFFMRLPNIPHADVPAGKCEEDNGEIMRWGEVRQFDFPVKDHVDLGEGLQGMDFQAAATMTGARFVTLHGQLARLQRALTQFMLDVHTIEHGYQEVYVPFLVNAQSLQGTGQLPKFKDDLFKTEDDFNYYLIPTAEVPVTNLARDQIFKPDQLPTKYVAHTPCFRSEAGTYGKDMRGLIRQHQFEKVELVQMVKPEDSYAALEELTGHAETILQKLNLPYRKVILCVGDLGFSSAKTYDLEVWLPGQDCYREISSCSNFENFQARRLKARWRNPDVKKPELIHTVNGSGLAVGRTLVAVLENYQDAEGNIVVPEVLRPYLGGMETIRK